MSTETERLDHTDPRLAEAIQGHGFPAGLYHTGGGVYVLEVALDGSEGADGFHTRASGVVLWITREDEKWLLGLYDLSSEDEDLGFVVTADFVGEDPANIAEWISGYVDRIKRIVSAKRTLVLKDEDEAGGQTIGPLFLVDADDRYEAVGGTSVWFNREQAIALGKSFRTPVRFD